MDRRAWLDVYRGLHGRGISGAHVLHFPGVFVRSEPASASEMLGVLARTATAMGQAAARNTVVALASDAATQLLDAEGICLISTRHDRCIYTAHKDSRPITARLEDARLQRLVSATAAQLREEKPQNALVATSSVQRLTCMLLIPLAPGSGWNTFGVFWSRPHQPDHAGTQALETLGAALGLALQSQSREQELARSTQHTRQLAAELQHRVRNILAFVRSIIRRTGETAESAEEFALHLEARISALARTQSTLTSAGHTGVEFEELVRAEMTATAIREDRLRISGPPIRLHAKGAETIALALHELATNSLKYGALTVPQGRITVNWQTDWTVSPPRLRVSWIESGVKIAVLAPRRRGFGQELIEHTLPYQLNAQTCFTFMPGGLHCMIDVPLNERTAAASTPGASQDRTRGHGTSNLNQ